ncbi:cytochrome c biogenesis protein CcdA [bacterium]|nr:cytochrome c biogenesis protein CcdA [bacterium]
MAEQITILGAFFGGLLAFFSPCILPLIPSYIAFISGVSLIDAQAGKVNKMSIFISSLFFVIGFSLIFVLLGASATTVGKYLFSNSKLLSQIGGGLIIILGLATAGIIDVPFLKYEKRMHMKSNPLGLFGAFLVGVVFALGWSPCIGPILAAILAMASQQQSVGKGMLLLSMFSAGLAIPFLGVSLALNTFLKFMVKIRRYMEVVELVSGKMLVVMGMMLFLGTFGLVSEAMGEITLLSASIFITFITVAVTQVWILVAFVNWMQEQGKSQLPWSARMLFFIDLLSIALMQVVNTFKEHMYIEE